MFSRFFIERPIFASVIAIVIVIAGGVSLLGLPIAQYPEITPPTVNVSANYPGANAEVVSATVAQPIEEQVNGVENMLYMDSTCSADGSYSLTVTFEVGTDLDIATVLVQNRVGIATAKLPEEVKRLGVTTQKQSPNMVELVALSSPDGRYDDLYLSNFATMRIKDELARTPGVGFVKIFGVGDYSMRIWLDPEQMDERGVTTTEVFNAIREQNVQVAAGQIGAPPAPADQAFQYTVNVKGRLSDPKEFGNIIIRSLSPELNMFQPDNILDHLFIPFNHDKRPIVFLENGTDFHADTAKTADNIMFIQLGNFFMHFSPLNNFLQPTFNHGLSDSTKKIHHIANTGKNQKYSKYPPRRMQGNNITITDSSNCNQRPPDCVKEIYDLSSCISVFCR